MVVIKSLQADLFENSKSNDGILKSQSVKKYLTKFTTVTAVHVADALTMQKDCSPDTTVFPYIDMLYLKTLNLTDQLPKWVECYNNMVQEEV